jgi:hypothetical protein
MIKKTREYSMFKFRPDNRAKIDQGHVNRLIKSIEKRNLLEMKPIDVNSQMEIIDGQHRLLAARHLNLDVYYQVNKDLNCNDIIPLNVAKSWTTNDYFNYFVHQKYPEYLKLQDFMQRNNVTLKVALLILIGRKREPFLAFREGDFKLKYEGLEYKLDFCWETVNYINAINGPSAYTTSARFWQALTILVSHDGFDPVKWKKNLELKAFSICQKASGKDYLKMLLDVYNFQNREKIEIEMDKE